MSQERFFDDHAPGDLVSGVVVAIRPFGCFIEVAENVHALLHGSEADVWPEPGTQVQARILDLDPHLRRLSLALV